MVIVEMIGRVRREHFVKGKTIKEIARDLKISRNTVRKILRSGETSFSYDRGVQPRPKLENWSADLDRLLATNAAIDFASLPRKQEKVSEFEPPHGGIKIRIGKLARRLPWNPRAPNRDCAQARRRPPKLAIPR